METIDNFRPSKENIETRGYLRSLVASFEDLDNQNEEISEDDIWGINGVVEEIHHQLVIDFIKNINNNKQPYLYYKQGFSKALQDHIASIARKLDSTQ